MENAQMKKENTETIKDLIAANHERVKGYSKAISLLDNGQDSDLISVFENYSQQAQQFKSQLIPLVFKEGEQVDDVEKLGQINQNWLEVADAHGYGSRETVLVACERGERENEKIYSAALDSIQNVEESVMETIRSQAQLQSLAVEHLNQLLELEVDKSHE